jgi:hypothetical protein
MEYPAGSHPDSPCYANAAPAWRQILGGKRSRGFGSRLRNAAKKARKRGDEMLAERLEGLAGTHARVQGTTP